MFLQLKFRRVIALFMLLMLVGLVVSACSTGVQVSPSEVPSVFHTPTSVANAEKTPPFSQSALAPASVISSMQESSTVTATPALEAIEIESGDPRYVSKAFWSNDGKIVYYAFARGSGAKPLKWAAYDTASRSTTIISSPLKYDPSIWKHLGVPEPQPSADYVELQGFLSPSGKRVIYDIQNGYVSPVATEYPQKPQKTEVWVGDLDNQRKTQVGEIPGGWGVYEINWFDDETKAVLAVSAATSDIHIADLQTREITPLEDFSNIKIVESAWLGGVSPDNKYLAVVSLSGLWLVSLKSSLATKIDEDVEHTQWSRDGTTLYYNRGLTEFRAYNVVSNQVAILIRQPKYETIDAEFSVAPSGDRIAFWGGWLRVTTLNR